MKLIGRATLTFEWEPGATISLLEIGNNIPQLVASGYYEQALAAAARETWRSDRLVSVGRLRTLFQLANRERLLALGDPLPPGESFTLYRGVVADTAPAGLFWSSSICIARYFSLRADPHGHPWPATTARQVYTCNVPAADVYLCSRYPDGEFVVDPPASIELLESGADEILSNWQRDGMDVHFQRLQRLAPRRREDPAEEIRHTRAIAAQLGIRLK